MNPNIFATEQNVSLVRKIINGAIHAQIILTPTPTQEEVEKVMGLLTEHQAKLSPATIAATLTLMWEAQNQPTVFARRRINDVVAHAIEAGAKRATRKIARATSTPQKKPTIPRGVEEAMRKLFENPHAASLTGPIREALLLISQGKPLNPRITTHQHVRAWLQQNDVTSEQVASYITRYVESAAARIKSRRTREQRAIGAHFAEERRKKEHKQGPKPEPPAPPRRIRMPKKL